MRRKSHLISFPLFLYSIFYCFSITSIGACHKIIPYESSSSDSTLQLDNQIVDFGERIDQLPKDRTQKDIATGDDQEVADQTTMDASVVPADLSPDLHPHFDFGGTICKTLWLHPKTIQVSATTGKGSASSPSIVAVGDIYYVAYIENNQIYVRRIDPLGSTSAAAGYQISSTTPAGLPWITYNNKTNRLAVLWSEKVFSKFCFRYLMLRELELKNNEISSLSSCNLSSNYSSLGYSPGVLLYDNQKYVIATSVDTTQCNDYKKGKTHILTAGKCVPFPNDSSYNLSSTTWFPIVGKTGDANKPYFVARLYSENQTTLPKTMKLLFHEMTANTTNSEGTFYGYASLSRPTTSFDGRSAWLAWVTTDRRIDLRIINNEETYYTILPFDLPTTNETLRDIFLASNTISSATVLVYNTKSTGSSNYDAINLAKLEYTAGVLKTKIYPIISVTGESPTSPVVAAGKNGFGIAWVNKVSSGQTEVFFRGIGCQ